MTCIVCDSDNLAIEHDGSPDQPPQLVWLDCLDCGTLTPLGGSKRSPADAAGADREPTDEFELRDVMAQLRQMESGTFATSP